MRIDRATASFIGVAQPKFVTPSPQQITNPLDEVVPQRCGIRYFIERGQAFGLFAKDIEVQSNIPPEKIIKAGTAELNQFCCATIVIDMPEGKEIQGIWGRDFSIYKDRNTGAYQLGVYHEGCFVMGSDVMNEAEMGIAVMEWSRKFATDNKCKQRAFLDTFSDRPVPDQGYVFRAAKAAAGEVASYWRKTFG